MSGKTARRNRKNAEKNRSEFTRFKKADDELTSLCQDFLLDSTVFDWVSKMDPVMGVKIVSSLVEATMEMTIGEFFSLTQDDPDGRGFTDAAIDCVSTMGLGIGQEVISAMMETAAEMTLVEFFSLIKDDPDGLDWAFTDATTHALLGMPLRNLVRIDGVEFTLNECEVDDTGEASVEASIVLPNPERAA